VGSIVIFNSEKYGIKTVTAAVAVSDETMLCKFSGGARFSF